jgi:hypothetical protein
MTGTHNVRFAAAQEEYFKKRDKKHLDQMYRICFEMAGRYIAKYARGRGLRLDSKELAHDAAAYVIGLYLQKPDFRLEPMSGYMCSCCNSIMWRDKTWNKKTVSMEPLVEMELI